ncbi:hypothetical protein LPJ60_003244 [Coemansia sp. RSA 2675]|nr:hypothetical protein LPJ60_003244 [Coemansia sp. RSA 2675]
MTSQQAPEDKMAEYKEAFALFDKDGDGTITAKELGEVLKASGHAATETDLRDMVNEIDADGNGTIDLQEFIALMERHSSKSCEQEELREAFKVFDKDDNGFITKSELRQAMKDLGENLTDKEIDAMILEVDDDANGEIDFKEFSKMMTGDKTAQPAPSQPIAVQPVAVQPVAVQPVAVQPVAVQPVAVQPVAVQPVAIQPVAIQPVAVQPVAALPVAIGKPVAAEEKLTATVVPTSSDNHAAPTA